MSRWDITPVPSSDSFASRSRYEWGSSRGESSFRGDRSRFSVDLVAAARRHLAFLRAVTGSPVLHEASVIASAIRRYEELWMPLMSEISQAAPPSETPVLVPPSDVEWVWHCHCLHPASYREYCTSRFGELIDRPVIIDDENEEYASARCREIWNDHYPSEPFDMETEGVVEDDVGGGGAGELFEVVARYRTLCSFFTDPFVSETVFLVAARRRYSNFLNLASKVEDGLHRLVPASDILLMWLTHQSYPKSYEKDTEETGDLTEKVVAFGERPAEVEAEETRRAWEEAFDEPYEKAGAALDPESSPSRVYFNWEAAAAAGANRRYKWLQPRFLMEVSVFLKGRWGEKETKYLKTTFLRLRVVRSHREMKLDKPVYDFSSDNWCKTWLLYCEFGTRGIVVEVRRRGTSCLRNSKLIRKVVFLWNDVLRATTHSLKKDLELEMRALTSVTPPVQAPYLLKCVPDRVTDDSGATISDVILRMNRYRPQEGRWLTRTVLDHARRECFVIRMRVGRGIWRRGAETPALVKWEDRIIEVREGPWSYIAGSVGTAPEKIVGTATPKKEDSQEKKATWCLSTGEVLTIQWVDGLDIQLESESSSEQNVGQVKMLTGRKFQYQVKDGSSSSRWEEEEGQYFTLVRFTPEHPDGKATALFNWKLVVMEFSPEEDAVLILLVCMAVVRTISEIRREDASGLLLRRRVREVEVGYRDWGSVILPSSNSGSSPHLQPWYMNAEQVLASAEKNDFRIPISIHSPADGKDNIYKQVILP